MSGTRHNSPWAWVPTLYIAEGLPYVLATGVSLVMLQNLETSNAAAAFWATLLGLPWIFKPLWSGWVERRSTRRGWIWGAQLAMAATLGGIAASLAEPGWLPLTLSLFWVLAILSATHDIAADGYYMLALTEGGQALFSGVRNTFYRLASLAASGGLVIFAGWAHGQTGSYPSAWLLAFSLAACAMAGLSLYHRRRLARPAADRPAPGARAGAQREEAGTFTLFFKKPGIVAMLAFVLFYRFGEAQLLPVARLFLLDARADGGLGLTNEQFGLVYGTGGLAALLAGGLLGGVAVAWRGLKFWLWPMLASIHLPSGVFIWLAYAQPENTWVIGAAVALEQFGYGFGFTAFMMYLIRMARGPHSTAHYALCTGFMAVGMTVPGLWSGWLQEQLGYQLFFIWVVMATVPSFLVTLKIPLEREFGKKTGPE